MFSLSKCLFLMYLPLTNVFLFTEVNKEICYGPSNIYGTDNHGHLVIGCLTRKGNKDWATNYRWFQNSNIVAVGERKMLMYVFEPGIYKCIVERADIREESEEVEVIECCL